MDLFLIPAPDRGTEANVGRSAARPAAASFGTRVGTSAADLRPRSGLGRDGEGDVTDGRVQRHEVQVREGQARPQEPPSGCRTRSPVEHRRGCSILYSAE